MAEDESAGRPGESENDADEAHAAEQPTTVDGLREALETARAQADQFRDQALRAQAETENVRRRAQRDVENAHKFAIEKFVAELLPVADSLDRAVEIAQANKADEATTAIAEGVELSLKVFLDALARAEVLQIDPTGEPFNPQFHEAMSTVDSPDSEPGSVVHVLQKGYTLNGRLVRAARVMVAKAPS